eukprot:3270335-Prymnesium_polylepis.1
MANSRHVARARLCIGALVCTTLLLMAIRISGSTTTTLQLVAGAGPATVIVGVAALLPRSLPSACTRWATLSLSIMIALNIQGALVRWRESDGEPYAVRHLRVVPGATLALGAAWLMQSVRQSSGSSFWFALRLALVLTNSVRLAVVLLLRALDAAPGSFPPGKLCFESAVRFHIGCLAFVTFVLSPPLRRRLSEWTGGHRVVLSLMDISRTMAAAADATDDAPRGTPGGALGESAADDSAAGGGSPHGMLFLYPERLADIDEGTGYTESVMSTFLQEDDRFDEPLNTLDNHPYHSSL